MQWTLGTAGSGAPHSWVVDDEDGSSESSQPVRQSAISRVGSSRSSGSTKQGADGADERPGSQRSETARQNGVSRAGSSRSSKQEAFAADGTSQQPDPLRQNGIIRADSSKSSHSQKQRTSPADDASQHSQNGIIRADSSKSSHSQKQRTSPADDASQHSQGALLRLGSSKPSSGRLQQQQLGKSLGVGDTGSGRLGNQGGSVSVEEAAVSQSSLSSQPLKLSALGRSDSVDASQLDKQVGTGWGRSDSKSGIQLPTQPEAVAVPRSQSNASEAGRGAHMDGSVAVRPRLSSSSSSSSSNGSGKSSSSSRAEQSSRSHSSSSCSSGTPQEDDAASSASTKAAAATPKGPKGSAVNSHRCSAGAAAPRPQPAGLRSPATSVVALTSNTTAPARMQRETASTAGRQQRSSLFRHLALQREASLKGHSSSVRAVATGPRQRGGAFLIATASWGSSIRLWKAPDVGQRVSKLQGHQGPVYGLCFSSDGSRLFSAGDDRSVKVWDTLSAQLLQSLEGHVGRVWGVACLLSAAGQQLVLSASEDKTMRVWRPRGGAWACLRLLEGHRKDVNGVAALACPGPALARRGHQSLAASCSDDGTVRVWSLDTWACLQVLEAPGQVGKVNGVAWAPDDVDYGMGEGNKVLAVFEDGSMRVWAMRSRWDGEWQCVATAHRPDGLRRHRSQLTCLAVSADGGAVASGSDDGSLALWSAGGAAGGGGLRCVAEQQGHRSWVRGVAWSPDGAHLFSGAADAKAEMWRVCQQ